MSSTVSQSTQRSSSRGHSSGNANAGFLVGSVFLGICILIAGLNIGGNLKALTKSVNDKAFASTSNYTVPSDFSYIGKSYLTETEAAKYLNLSEDEVLKLISSGEINEYVKTDNGYSISVKVLDAWFENAAYQTKLGSSSSDKDNADNSEAAETTSAQ